MAGQTSYRSDIDGLRAIAVLPVVLFHLGFRYTPGGFLGVDVFFVISGYLITSHIVTELEAGCFSIANFYERRIRRIAPALLFVLMCSSIVAYLLFYPVEFVEFAKALLASVLSLSNIYFWKTTDYFADQGGPLLHTWSLAVEEQFYLLVPVVLLLAFRRGRRCVLWTLAFIACISLLLCLLTYHKYPEATFYLLPQRAFELLIGSLTGLVVFRRSLSQMVRELLSFTGLAMTLVFVVRLPPSWIFPGPGVLIPCIGAALVLGVGASGRTLIGDILSIPPLRSIGLISYSTYLWHVPLISFASHLTGVVYGRLLGKLCPFLSPAQAITVERLLLLLAASLSCGYFSWRFIEQPTRFGQFRPSRRVLFTGAGVAAFALATLSGMLIALHGLPSRFPAEVVAITSVASPSLTFTDGICFPVPMAEFQPRRCKQLDSKRPNWLLIGDSHAGHLDYGLHVTFPEVNIVQFVMLGCKPVPESRFGELESCSVALQELYRSYLPQHHFDLIIMAANWQPFDIPRIQTALIRLDQLHQPAMLVGPIMQYDVPLRLLLANQILDHDPTLAERHRVRAFDELDAQMAQKAKDDWHVPYFSYSVFCPSGHCMVWSSKDVPLQWDETHLLPAGSVLAVSAMRAQGILVPSRHYDVEQSAREAVPSRGLSIRACD